MITILTDKSICGCKDFYSRPGIVKYRIKKIHKMFLPVFLIQFVLLYEARPDFNLGLIIFGIFSFCINNSIIIPKVLITYSP